MRGSFRESLRERQFALRVGFITQHDLLFFSACVLFLIAVCVFPSLYLGSMTLIPCGLRRITDKSLSRVIPADCVMFGVASVNVTRTLPGSSTSLYRSALVTSQSIHFMQRNDRLRRLHPRSSLPKEAKQDYAVQARAKTSASDRHTSCFLRVAMFVIKRHSYSVASLSFRPSSRRIN